MFSRTIGYTVSATLLAALAACGGGGSSDLSSIAPATPQSVNVPLLISDASSEDWSMIGVEILSVAFVPQGGGADVTVYSASSPAPVTNLVQLDNLSDVIGNPAVAPGTYAGAIVTVSANPGDVQLVTASNPEPGFPVAGGTTIPSSDIQIQGATGSTGSMTVPIKVNFTSPVTVAGGSTTPVDVEFNLSHPAFIVGHTPPSAGGDTIWAVNFNGPMVRHHPIADIAHLVLRHAYGKVSGVSSDNASITIAKDVPTRPIVNPETATATGQKLTILADATNGTLFYDVDAQTRTTIRDFSSLAATLPAKYLRVAARYQESGALVATRIWASTSFNRVWISPEGHVTHVDAANSQFGVDDETGHPVLVGVDANTEFVFQSATIGTGPAFLNAGYLARGFKVHVSGNPLASAGPLVAQTVEIETARYDGDISAVTANGFNYTRKYRAATDDYSVTLDFISSNTANGTDSSGNAITGFKYWDLAFPTLVTSGSNAIGSFTAATSTNVVNFGGTIGKVVPWGATFGVWGDSITGATTGWSAPWVVLEPVPLPLGVVAGTTPGLSANQTFMMTVPNAATLSPTIDVGTTSGSATLVYQVDRSNGVVTVSPEDVTTSSGLEALNAGLTVGAPVKVYGVPQSDGSLRAYVLFYFTGAVPML